MALGAALWIAAPRVVGAASASDGPTSKKANALFLEAHEDAKNGRPEDAIDKFRASFEEEAHPATLWGLAQLTRQLQGCREAVKLYEQFASMVEEDSPAYQVAVEARADCAPELAREDDTSAQPALESSSGGPDDTPPPEATERGGSRPWHRDPLAGVLVGLGASGTVAGAAVLIAAAVEHAEEPDDYGSFVEREERVERLQIAGGVVIGVGGALLIGGIVRWAVLGARQSKRGRVTALLGPDRAGLAIQGQF